MFNKVFLTKVVTFSEIVIIKMFNIFAQKQTYNYFSHTLLVMIFPMETALYMV